MVEVLVMPRTDTQATADLSDLREMLARGQIKQTAADAASAELPEGFWDTAEVSEGQLLTEKGK